MTALAGLLAELPPDQTYAVQKALKQLDRLLQTGAGPQELRAITDELGKLTGGIADDVISSAITKALRQESGS